MWSRMEIGLRDVVADRVDVIPGGYDIPEWIGVDNPIFVNQFDTIKSASIHFVPSAHQQSIGQYGVVIFNTKRRPNTS